MAASSPRRSPPAVTQVIFATSSFETCAPIASKLAGTGIAPVFPIWGRRRRRSQREMIDGGGGDLPCTHRLNQLPKNFAGRALRPRASSGIKPDADPCGDKGEFSFLRVAGPMLCRGALHDSRETVRARRAFAFLRICPRRKAARLCSGWTLHVKPRNFRTHCQGGARLGVSPRLRNIVRRLVNRKHYATFRNKTMCCPSPQRPRAPA